MRYFSQEDPIRFHLYVLFKQFAAQYATWYPCAPTKSKIGSSSACGLVKGRFHGLLDWAGRGQDWRDSGILDSHGFLTYLQCTMLYLYIVQLYLLTYSCTWDLKARGGQRSTSGTAEFFKLHNTVKNKWYIRSSLYVNIEEGKQSRTLSLLSHPVFKHCI